MNRQLEWKMSNLLFIRECPMSNAFNVSKTYGAPREQEKVQKSLYIIRISKELLLKIFLIIVNNISQTYNVTCK